MAIICDVVWFDKLVGSWIYGWSGAWIISKCRFLAFYNCMAIGHMSFFSCKWTLNESKDDEMIHLLGFFYE
jgi:hypothetical protein